MSQFKTKKLDHTPVKKIQDAIVAPLTPTDTKKKIRKIIAGLLIILAVVFGVNYVVQ